MVEGAGEVDELVDPPDVVHVGSGTVVDAHVHYVVEDSENVIIY